MGRKVITFLLPSLAGGGAERVAVTLMQQFRKAGHSVEFVLMQSTGELLHEIPPEVRIVDLGAKRVRHAIRPLIRYFREAQPDAVQARMWPLTIAAVIARRVAKSSARLVVSDHGIVSDHLAMIIHPIVRLTMRAFYPFADARVTVSRGAARDLARISRLPESTFTVIHNPIAFPVEVESSREVETGWGSASHRILTVGQLKAEKDHAFLIRTFQKLPDALGASLMIVGSGPLEHDLKRMVEDLGLSGRVLFPGHASDPWPFYASADLFVLGSREESFGNVLVEALHAGLPIVSTRTTGAEEVLDGGRFGALVTPGDTDRFAAAMEMALTRPPGRIALRERAKELSGDASVAAYFSLLLN